MFPNLGPVVCWNKQWISEVHKKNCDLQKNKQHLSPDSLCGLYELWINQVLDELECVEPSSRGMQPYGFWGDLHRSTFEHVNYWAVPTRLPLWGVSCNLTESRLTPVHFIHVPHQTGPWCLLLSGLFPNMNCPVPATFDKGEKSCSLKPESRKS